METARGFEFGSVEQKSDSDQNRHSIGILITSELNNSEIRNILQGTHFKNHWSSDHKRQKV